MIIGTENIKYLASLGAFMSFVKQYRRRPNVFDNEPHFHDDPVPGDSFPHHIFHVDDYSYWDRNMP